MAITTSPLRLQRLDLAATWPPASRRRSRIVAPSSGAAPCPIPRSASRPARPSPTSATRGDAAVRDANARVGGGRPDGRLVVDPAELRAARDGLDTRTRRALDQAIDHVTRFAETQRPTSTRTEIAPGIEIERRWNPLASVGAYVPGGSAPYPSSLIMTVVPARVAGVDRVVVASPADRDGATNPVLLGVAGLLEVDAFVVAGGAQAIGALAYGLPDAGLEPVDRIVGPGNAWVTAAKIEVCGEVGIDLPAGPSEGLVLAAPPADARRVALDLLTQAEHGPDSPAILVTTDADFADAVEREVGALLGHGLSAATSWPARSPSTAASCSRPISMPRSSSSTTTHPSTCPSTSSRSRRRSIACATPARSSSARGRPSRRATTRRAPTTCCRPAAWLARRAGSRSRAYGKFVQVQRISRDGLAGHRRDHHDPGRGGGPARPPRCRHPPLRTVRLRRRSQGCRPMSPTPVTFTSPTAPASYSWEATDEEVSARYGVPIERVVRFDLNTSPAPPDLAARVLAEGRFETPLSEYAPSDYRRLIAAAADRYGVGTDEVIVGAGADEILDIVGKVYLPPGEYRGRPDAELRDVSRDHRAARSHGRRGAAARRRRRLRHGRAGGPRGRPHGRRRVAVQPEQPDRAAGTGRRDRDPPRRPRGGRRQRRPRPRRSSSSTRPTPSSSIDRSSACASATRT